MSAWRVLGIIGLLLAATRGGWAQTYMLAEKPQAGECFKIQLNMKLSGEMRIHKDDKTEPLKLEAAAVHEYPERILIVSSDGLVQKTARHYETAKAALVGFTRAVAADWAPHGVTVNAIAPGGFLTEPNRRWFREKPGFQQEIESLIPMGRLGEPEELGSLALYRASDASSYMTGALLFIDGGYTLW